jgi:cysteine synthase A
VFTTTDKQSKEKTDVMKAMGAEVIVCPTDVEPDDPRSYYSTAKRIAEETPNSFYVNQYDNLANTRAHYETTGPEIWEATGGKVDILVAGVGTGGTISGISRYFEQVKNQPLYSVAVEPAESPIIGQAKRGESLTPGPHKIQGIGANFIPKNLDLDLVDEVIAIESSAAIEWARKTATHEGILVGISSGAAMAAAAQLAARPENAGKTIVVILPDAGERYLSSVLFEDISAD